MNAARSRIGECIADFFFQPDSGHWVSFLRIGLALQVILYCVSLGTDWNYLFAGHGGGLISRQASEFLLSGQSVFVPRLSWFVSLGRYLGLTESTSLFLIWLVLLDAALLLLLGLFSRGAAIASWLLYLSSAKSGGLLSYGVDSFTTIGLFYLMISPLPDRWSVDYRSRRVPLKDRYLAGFFRRILQLHLCFIYFFGGLAKCLGPDWWNGESIWRALTHPAFNMIAPEILVHWHILFPIASVGTAILEVAYPVFIWPQLTRRAWLLGIVGLHVAVGLIMGMYLFGLIMIILNVAAFGPEYLSRWATRWQRLRARDAELP